jgi:hypothetical protein
MMVLGTLPFLFRCFNLCSVISMLMLRLLTFVRTALTGGFLMILVSCAREAALEVHDWRSDWAVADGFALDMDTEGYHFPSAIAFVPTPGSAPKDPLYFITELRGTIKVIANDRSVHTFAEKFFHSRPSKELPDVAGETGMAGICLDPKHGYVFVTYAYTDSAGVLRNGITRFTSSPGTFSLHPTAQMALSGIFERYESAISHQVGGCQVDGNLLYVSVADGRQTSQSQNPNSVLGKILRMTVDGRPAPDNPFYQDKDPHTSANLVWSMGLRNPFGIRFVHGKVIVADNGSGIDRIIDARRGANYLWSGTDVSIGTNALVVIFPSVGPVQMEYIDKGTTVVPTHYQRMLFVACSSPRYPGVVRLGYDPDTAAALTPPARFIDYVGSGLQAVVGVAAGPDGLYFVPLFPDRMGRSAILRVRYDPINAHTVHLATARSADALLREKACLGCHSLGGQGGAVAPPLDRETLLQRVRTRVESDHYPNAIHALDLLEKEPFRSFRPARQEVLREKGERRIRTWVKYRILEPRFDDPNAQMPSLDITQDEARVITAYLLDKPSLIDQLRTVLTRVLSDRLKRRDLVVLGIGVVLGVTLSLSVWLMCRTRKVS